MKIKHILTIVLLMLSLSGCVSTIVGGVVDLGAEIAKAPAKVGSAVVRSVGKAVTPDKKDDAERKEEYSYEPQYLTQTAPLSSAQSSSRVYDSDEDNTQ